MLAGLGSAHSFAISTIVRTVVNLQHYLYTQTEGPAIFGDRLLCSQI